MDKRSFNLDVFPENDGVFLRFEAEDYGIEQSFVKYNENPAGFVENYCKKHCLGLMAKQLLLFKLQQKLSEISFCEKNVGNPGFFNDLIKTKENFNDGSFLSENITETKPKVLEKTKIHHRRNKSDGYSYVPMQKTLKESNNSNFSHVSMKNPKTSDSRSTTPLNPNKNNSGKSNKNINSYKNCSSNAKIKPSKRKFPIENLSECISKLQIQAENLKKESFSKFFSSEQSEKIQKRVKYLRFKEIFDKLKPNSKGFINKNTIKLTTLNEKQISILRPLLEEINKYDENLSFNDFLESIKALFEYFPSIKLSHLLAL